MNPDTDWSALNLLPTAIAVLDAGGAVRFVNDAWRVQEAARRPALLADVGHTWALSAYLQGDEAAHHRLADAIAEVVSGVTAGLDAVCECEADDGIAWWSIRLHRPPAHTAPLTVVTQEDVSATARAQADLLLAKFAMDNSAAGIYWFDATGQVLYANDAACDMLGYTADEMRQRAVWEIDTACTPAEWRAGWAELRSRLPLAARADYRRRDGTAVPVEVSVNAFEYLDRTYAFAFVQDATERLRCEQQLRLASSAGRIGFWEFDLETEALRLDDTVRALIGLAPDEPFTPGDWARFVSTEDLAAALERARRLAANELGDIDTEYHVTRPDGTPVTLLVRGAVAPGHPRRVVGTATDITAIQQAANRLEAAVHERETLLRELHHRVKNNLQVVLSLLSLQAHQLGRNPAAARLRDAHVRIQTIALAHDQLYRGADLDRVPLDRYLRSIASNALRVYAGDGERIRLTVSADPVTAPFDAAVRLGLLLNEIVSNAMRHAFPEGRTGRVEVTLTGLDEETFALTVADDGVGIPADVGPESSDGLGLQLAHDFATQLGGRLEVAAGVEGHGTRIHARCRPRRPARTAAP